MSPRTEWSPGLIAALAVLGGLGLALFGPAVFTSSGGVDITGSASLFQHGADAGRVMPFVTVMLIAASGLAIGTDTRGRGGSAGTLALLWGSLALVLVGMIATLPGTSTIVVPTDLAAQSADSVGVGIYFGSAVGLALLADVLSLRAHHAPPRRP